MNGLPYDLAAVQEATTVVMPVMPTGGVTVLMGDLNSDAKGEPGDRTASGLWPSDQAGLVGDLKIPAAIFMAR